MKHPSIPPRLRPEEALLRQFAQGAGLPFVDVLSAELLHHVLEDCQVEYRERIFSPLVTAATFLSQVLDPDHGMRQAVARLLAYRTSVQLPACSPAPRAYGKARQRLPEKVWAELTRRTGRQLMLEAPTRWRWHGRDVRASSTARRCRCPTRPPTNKPIRNRPAKNPDSGFPSYAWSPCFRCRSVRSSTSPWGRTRASRPAKRPCSAPCITS